MLQAVLGKECQVEATLGHFREIETFDVETGRVSWRVETGRKSMIASMAALLGDVDELVLATDDDREGDAIAWHFEVHHIIPLDDLGTNALSNLILMRDFEHSALTAYQNRATGHLEVGDAAMVDFPVPRPGQLVWPVPEHWEATEEALWKIR